MGDKVRYIYLFDKEFRPSPEYKIHIYTDDILYHIYLQSCSSCTYTCGCMVNKTHLKELWFHMFIYDPFRSIFLSVSASHGSGETRCHSSVWSDLLIHETIISLSLSCCLYSVFMHVCPHYWFIHTFKNILCDFIIRIKSQSTQTARYELVWKLYRCKENQAEH